jgi:hypothetical protein
MSQNNEMTLKLPRVVHRLLKQLAASRSVPMYTLLARMLLREIADPNTVENKCFRKESLWAKSTTR